MEVKEAKIDKDVIEEVRKTDEEINAVLGDEILCKRMILNAFCEMLSLLRDTKRSVDDLNELITVCSADKLTEFFKEVNTNFSKETKRVKAVSKIQDHKKKK